MRQCNPPFLNQVSSIQDDVVEISSNKDRTEEAYDPVPLSGSHYATAAFNEDGSILYIWTIGDSEDTFYGLKIGDGRVHLLFKRIFVPVSGGNYPEVLTGSLISALAPLQHS